MYTEVAKNAKITKMKQILERTGPAFLTGIVEACITAKAGVSSCNLISAC